MSDLQLALLALGAVFVACVAGYNVMQERRARRKAEDAFRASHPDALLDPQAERREPTMGAIAAPAIEEPAPSLAPDLVPVEAPDEPPFVPTEGGAVLAAQVDTLALVLADAPVTREQLAPLLDALETYPAGVAVEGLEAEQWKPVADSPQGAWRELRAGLQLASRAGPVAEEQVAAFNDTVAGFAASINAVSQRESPALAAARARELDRFCAEVDFEVAITVARRGGATFALAKVKSLALEQGLAETASGAFERRDAAGAVAFTLRVADSDAGGRSWCTGLTFALDVPLVADPAGTLSRMAALASRFGEALGGDLVDDAAKPLGPKGLEAIRRSLEQVESRMQAHGVPAGSPLARRLFA